MAMSGSTLGNKLYTDANIDESKLSQDELSKIKAYYNTLATDIVSHITTFAEIPSVASTVTVVSVSGVTTGPGASGPGTGTASGTVPAGGIK